MNEHFGVREFINLTVNLLRYYQRHKANVDEHLNEPLEDAMELLLSVLPLLIAANAPGPNPAVPDINAPL